MARLTIDNFKFGLDTRRTTLTSPNGTLAEALNLYVNQGGELVKRPGFQRKANFNITEDGDQTQGVFFGLYVGTDFGYERFLVFGCALPFGTTPTQGQPVLSAVLPSFDANAEATYQQLKHPSLTNDVAETYSSTYHLMTRLVKATLFNGKALVVAEFNDGNSFMYFDGALVQQSANGLVLAGRSDVADLSIDLDRQLESVQWNGIPNVNESLVAQNGSTIVNSPPADYFGIALSQDTTAGLLGHRFISQDAVETNGVRATAKFKVTVAGTFELLAPLNEDGTSSTSLMGGTVTGGTVAATVTAIIAAVNDFTSFHGYSASAPLLTTDEVQIAAPLGFDVTTAIDLTVNPSGGGATGASTGAAPFTATLTVVTGTLANNTLSVVRPVVVTGGNTSARVTGSVSINSTGGAGTTTVSVVPLPGGSGAPMVFRTSANNSFPVAFYADLAVLAHDRSVASFNLVITNVSETTTIPLTVDLSAIFFVG